MFRIVLLLTIINLLLPAQSSRAAMSSTNYLIYADSFDNGGFFGSSTSFTLQDTVGESPAGFTTSTSYEVRGGYQHMEIGTLSFTISPSSVSLGQLDTGLVKSGSAVATISTDSETGYSLSIGSVSGSGITSVSDGSVTAGSEEYGLAVSGSHAAFAGDRSITAGRVLASTSFQPVGSVDTTLTFKAAISGSTAAGSYSQTITLTASANI